MDQFKEPVETEKLESFLHPEDDEHESAMLDSEAKSDPLLDCLGFLAREHGKPFSRVGVMAGLPTEGDRLPIDLFARAALKIGLSSKLLKRSVKLVPGIVIPFIVLLKDGDACIVMQKAADRKRVAVVFSQRFR